MPHVREFRAASRTDRLWRLVRFAAILWVATVATGRMMFYIGGSP
jgi:hypothetical protein